MTKERPTKIKHRLSETILKFGRGMSPFGCFRLRTFHNVYGVRANVLPKQNDISLKRPRSEEKVKSEVQEEKEVTETFQPQRIRRSISFTGLGSYEIERLRCVGRKEAGHALESVTELSTTVRSRCHSFAGMKNKKLVEITVGPCETAIIDGLLTTTFCSTDL